MLGLGATTPGADADEATRRALTELKQQVVQAFVKRDRTTLDRIHADDYVATDARGRERTKQEELSRLGADGDTLLSGRYDRTYGDVAVMSGHGHLTWRTADGGTHTSDYYSFNVFERRHGEWKDVAAFLP